MNKFRQPIHKILAIGMATLLLAGLFMAASPFQQARAVVETVCTTNADGDWSGSIWDCAGGPTSADSVVILHNVTISGNAAVQSLTVRTDGANNLFGVLVFSSPVTLTVNKNLTVTSLGLLDPGEGTIVLGGGSQIIDTDGTWVDFYNLTKMASGSNDTLFFTPPVGDVGGVHVLHDLTLKGTSMTGLLKLRSTVAGQQWQLWVDETADVNFVDLQDAKNLGPYIPVVYVDKGLDSGNLTGWQFVGTSALLTSSELPGLVNKPVTFTVRITPSSATGTVTFYEDGAPIDECVNVPVVSGTATCTYTFLTAETETITAVFTADAPMNGSDSNILNQVIGTVKIFVPGVSK
jgi:hypothetical protein